VESKFDDDELLKLASLNYEKAVHLFSTTLEDVCSCSRFLGKRLDLGQSLGGIMRLRRETNRAKKQIMRARKMNIRNSIQDYKNAYRFTRNKYVNMIKKNKKDTWRQFVTEEGNKDPWSIVYKIVGKKYEQLKLHAL